MNKKTNENIDWSVISRNLFGKLSDSENEEFQEWLENDPKHKNYAEQSADFYSMIENDELERPDVDKAIAQFKSYTSKNKTRSLKFNVILKYAAAILIPISIGVFVMLQTAQVENDLLSSNIDLIGPGSSKAELLLADGERVTLDKNDTLFEKIDGTEIHNLSGVLSYKTNLNKTKLETYNTLNIPRGGEYQLQLADGTKVWLNSATSFKYPTNFTGDKRIVYLSGEAFFDVSHNKDMPFIVKVDDLNVKVLGTSFNVKAYSEEDEVLTTLVDGKVEVLAQGMDARLKTILRPDFQARYLKSSKTVKVDSVNTEIFISWKDGVFILDNANLEEISEILSRWYDVNFFFANEKVKENHFTGRMKKYENLQDILELLEQLSDVEFEIKNKAVIVQEKV